MTLLLEAKLAFYLKESLVTSTEFLALQQRFSRTGAVRKATKAPYLWLRSRPVRRQETIEVRIPLRNLAKELERQLPRAAVYQDLPARPKAAWLEAGDQRWRRERARLGASSRRR